MIDCNYLIERTNKTMSKKSNQLVEVLDATPKKRKNKSNRTLASVVQSFVQVVADIGQFVFFATAIAGGYVLFTQGSVNMRVTGGILLAGAVYFFASKTIKN